MHSIFFFPFSEPQVPRQGLRQDEDGEADEEDPGGGAHEEHVLHGHAAADAGEAEEEAGGGGHALRGADGQQDEPAGPQKVKSEDNSVCSKSVRKENTFIQLFPTKINMYGISEFPFSTAGYFNLGKSDKLLHVYRRKHFPTFLFFRLGSVSLTREKKSLHVQRKSVRFSPPFLAFLGRKMVAGMWEYERRPLSSLSTLFFPKCSLLLLLLRREKTPNSSLVLPPSPLLSSLLFWVLKAG